MTVTVLAPVSVSSCFVRRVNMWMQGRCTSVFDLRERRQQFQLHVSVRRIRSALYAIRAILNIGDRSCEHCDDMYKSSVPIRHYLASSQMNPLSSLPNRAKLSPLRILLRATIILTPLNTRNPFRPPPNVVLTNLVDDVISRCD
jgi:hypothetical protein